MNIFQTKSDTIGAQIIINIIDKLIIGGIVGLIVLYIQIQQKQNEYYIQEQQKMKELIFSASGIKTSILKQQRDNLIEQTTNYIRFVISTEVRMNGIIDSDDDRYKIKELYNNIAAIIFNIKNINQDGTYKKGEQLTESIRSFTRALITNGISNDESFNKNIDEIGKKYRSVILDINEDITKTLKEEYKKSR